MDMTITKEKKYHAFVRIVFWVIIGLLAALFFSALFAVAVTFLWNRLMPVLFGLPEVSYLQALGLLLLARLLVGGWHRGHHNKDGHGSFHDLFHRKDFHHYEEIHRNKKDFPEFWEEEGQEAFKRYLEKREHSG
jgi:hypothetical protein